MKGTCERPAKVTLAAIMQRMTTVVRSAALLQDTIVTGVAIISGRWYTLPAGHSREQHTRA